MLTVRSKDTLWLGPVIAAAYGFRNVYWGMSTILLVWAVVFVVFARNASEAVRPESLGEIARRLASEYYALYKAEIYLKHCIELMIRGVVYL